MTGLQSRQNFNNDDYVYGGWWEDTTTGNIVKWSIFFGLLFLLIAFFIAGRWHAMKRIKQGLPPKAYHRWMLSRRQRALYDPAYRTPHIYYTTHPPQNQYGMYPMPPPVYDPNSAPPPSYQPPGTSKIDPSQAGPVHGTSSSYETPAAPSGVPPAVQTQNTGSSNNPYRL